MADSGARDQQAQRSEHARMDLLYETGKTLCLSIMHKEMQ